MKLAAISDIYMFSPVQNKVAWKCIFILKGLTGKPYFIHYYSNVSNSYPLGMITIIQKNIKEKKVFSQKNSFFVYFVYLFILSYNRTTVYATLKLCNWSVLQQEKLMYFILLNLLIHSCYHLSYLWWLYFILCITKRIVWTCYFRCSCLLN